MDELQVCYIKLNKINKNILWYYVYIQFRSVIKADNIMAVSMGSGMGEIERYI